MPPRRVLMTADTIGGVWTYAIELARALAGLGIETTLAAMGGEPAPDQREEAGGIELFTAPYKLEWMEDPWEDVAAAGRWLAEIERRVRPDVVHLNGYAHAALGWRAPVLVAAHSCVLSWWEAVKHEPAPASWERYRCEVARGLAAASMVVAPTHAMMACITRHYGPPGAGRLIPNGRDASRFHPTEKQPLIFAAGRMWDEAKNLAALDAAAPHLSWPVYVAGEARRPAAAARLLGRLSAACIAEWLSRAAIYALPARYEPFGLSALEAALSGCALVLGDIPSLREVWGDAACFVPPEDTDALCSAIEGLIHSPTLRLEMSAKARLRALEYRPRRMAKAYLSAYVHLTQSAELFPAPPAPAPGPRFARSLGDSVALNADVQRPVRYAVVGLGYISQAAVLPAFANARENSTLAVLISSDPEKRSQLSKKYGVPRTCSYDEYDECLAEGIDAVYIALPNHMHREYTIRAARAGVHVLCEKPMAVTEEECEDMIRACAHFGVKLMIAYRLHFEAANLAAIDVVQSGRLGESRYFSSVFSQQVPQGNIRLRREMGGGTLYDIGIYCINAARYLLRDEPMEVWCATAAKDDPRFREVEETASAVLRFHDDRLAAFTCSFGAAETNSYRVVGTEGDLVVEPAYPFNGELKHKLTVGGRSEERIFGARDQFGPLFSYFSDCILSGRSPEPSGEEGLADVRVIRALYRSATEGRSVRLPPFERAARPTPAQEIHLPRVEEPLLLHAEDPSKAA